MDERAPGRDQAGPAIEDVLGPLGGAIVRIVIEQGESTVASVRAALLTTSDRQLAYTTVMTVLSRLHEKGILGRTRVGRGYVYRPAAEEAQLVDALSRRAVDDVLGRYGTTAMRQFAERLQDLDPALRSQLVALASVEKDQL